MTLDADGNAGYRSTPRIVAAAGLALARGSAPAGFLTPATALGSGFLEELEQAGVVRGLTVDVEPRLARDRTTKSPH